MIYNTLAFHADRAAVAEQLCGTRISSTQVSRIAKAQAREMGQAIRL